MWGRERTRQAGSVMLKDPGHTAAAGGTLHELKDARHKTIQLTRKEGTKGRKLQPSLRKLDIRGKKAVLAPPFRTPSAS